MNIKKFTEEELKVIVGKAVNKLYAIKEDVIATFKAIGEDINSTRKEEKQLEELNFQLNAVVEEQRKHLEKLKTSK